MNPKTNMPAIAMLASVNYPKIKEKNLAKVPESALNIFSWIISHLPLVLFTLAAIFIAIGIMQRVRDRKVQEAYEEEKRRAMQAVYAKQERERWMMKDAKAYNSRPGSRQTDMATLRQREFAKKQRAAMTPSLRHDILERDGFRCQHCGATAADGAKLHVDHIIPVAKGGKTEPSNLQTLCEECNLGKSDK